MYTKDLVTSEQGFVGDITGNISGVVEAGANIGGSVSGDVVVPLTTLFSSYTTNATAAIAATLADGVVGQMKIIKLTAKVTSDMVVTYNGTATATFDATGEIIVLVFDGANWIIIYSTTTNA